MICKICGPFYDGVGRNLQCHGLAGSVIPGNGDQVMSAPSFMQITPVTAEDTGILGYWDKISSFNLKTQINYSDSY